VFRVVVAGSRTFNNYELLKNTLDKLFKTKVDAGERIEIVSGMAKGADTLAIQYAKERGFQIKEFPAEWDRLGKSAGYQRNEKMAAYSDALVAFWDGKSRGTMHMVTLANQYHLMVRVIDF
jgi:hypothetical protein